MFTRIACLGLVTCLSLLAGCSSAIKASQTQTVVASHVDHAPLLVDNRNGAVSVTADAAATSVHVTAEITCTGLTFAEAQERLGATILSVERAADQTLVVKPVFAGGARGNDSASITITIPNARGAMITTSNGSIDAKGLVGTLTLASSNGRVQVERHNGDVSIDTSNGRIELVAISGTVRAETSNGRINGADLGGPVTARSSNGGITIALSLAQRGPMHLHTSNGAIDATVGPGFAGRVAFDTSNGRVSVHDAANRVSIREIDKNDGWIVVGEDASSSQVETSNGRITFTIASAPAPGA